MVSLFTDAGRRLVRARLWYRVWQEAQSWPSWDRSGPRFTERYNELLREAGVDRA